MSSAPDHGAPARKVLVVAIGNPDRGDDGVGALVVRTLAHRLPPDVAVMTVCGNPLSLLETWAQFDALVCVDAAAPVTAPGRVHRLDLAHSELPCALSPASSHGLGLAEAIGLGRALDRAPREIVVYAVEGACFEGAAAITPEVAAGAAQAADCIMAEVARLRRPPVDPVHASFVRIDGEDRA